MKNSYVTIAEAEAYFIMRSKELNMREEKISIGYDEEKYDSGKATLFAIGGKEIWIFNSLIIEKDNESVKIPLWFAESEELEGYEI